MTRLVRSDGPGSRLRPDAVPVPLATVSLRLDQKPDFDSVQGILSGAEGRRVNQWEVIAVLLEDAATNPHGRLARARRQVRFTQRGA